MRFFLFMLFAISCFALNDVSKPFTFAPKDPVSSSRINANYDTLYNRINQTNDSLDNKFIRFSYLNSHDSTIKYMKVDTIRSGPDIDTIKGNTRFTGSPTVAGSVTATGGFVGTATVADSLAIGNTTSYGSSTIVGWATPYGGVSYRKMGNLLFVSFGITGNSNSTTATFTLPYSVTLALSWCSVYNNGSYQAGNMSASGNVVYTGVGPYYVNNFTSSGSKEVSGSFFCFIN
jgi:hypothetical protein